MDASYHTVLVWHANAIQIRPVSLLSSVILDDISIEMDVSKEIVSQSEKCDCDNSHDDSSDIRRIFIALV